MLRRVLRRLGSTNRYYDGSGRKLDGPAPPSDLFCPPMSNRAYPRQGEHWQLSVGEEATPHKGTVIVAGAGVVGLTTATLFAMRGWHTTVVERARQDDGATAVLTSREAVCAAMDAHRHAHTDPPRTRTGDGDGEVEGDDAAAATTTPSLAELRYALVTRRAADVLAAAGVHRTTLRACGVAVDGVLDHPGDYHSWLTSGLVEQHAFAVRMLAIDLYKLRRALEGHVAAAVPASSSSSSVALHTAQHNLRVFYKHAITAVYPLRQELVVSDCRASPSPSQQQQQQQQPPRQTSLTLSERQWAERYAANAVSYDLLIGADGATSPLRSLLDVEGFVSDATFVTRWFVLRTTALCHRHVHRWLYRANTASSGLSTMLQRGRRGGNGNGNGGNKSSDTHVVDDDDGGGGGGVMSAAASVSMCCAFPRVEDETLFAVMAYMPAAQLSGLDDEAVLHTFLRDVVRSDATATLCGFAAPCAAAPTVFCENLYNSVGLPSAVVVGDAAHHCHPFWMQNLAAALEDGAHLLNVMDAYSRDNYDAVRQYSNERGVSGDALRMMTERCLYYERHKHTNLVLRACNAYRRRMHMYMPACLRYYNAMRPVNHYAASLEAMLNGRGYTSYDFAEQQQARHERQSIFARLYT